MNGKEAFDCCFDFFSANREYVRRAGLFPQSILLNGASGVGKTFLVEKKCAEKKIHLERVASLEEENVLLCFNRAVSHQFSVLFLDCVDLLIESNPADACSFLCHLIKKAKQSSSLVVVIAATNRMFFFNSNFARIFEKAISIGPPDLVEREMILRGFIKEKTVSVESISQKTEGFLACDLKNLYWTARASDRETIETADLEKNIPLVELSLGKKNRIKVEGCYRWEDIGGLKKAIEEIRRCVEIPLLYPKEMERIGAVMPHGILLYGPPGSSKTTIAKTIAKNCPARFFSIDSAELYSCYVGESERILRETFLNARQSSPSIVFIDEIDSIVGRRDETKENSVRERVLSTLLNEMDGVESLGKVIVLSATNRPELIDSALLRPGRFDKLIEIGYPGLEDRQLIFEACLKKISHDGSVDTKKLGQMTEGLCGADIKNICQEAGFISVRKKRCFLFQDDIEEAVHQAKEF